LQDLSKLSILFSKIDYIFGEVKQHLVFFFSEISHKNGEVKPSKIVPRKTRTKNSEYCYSFFSAIRSFYNTLLPTLK